MRKKLGVEDYPLGEKHPDLIVSKNGIIIFDEYGKRGWGETDAVDEYFKNKKNIQIQTIKYSNQPSAFVVKK